MEHVNKLSFSIKSYITCILLCVFFIANAQEQHIFTQYLNNPIIINPAFTGNRNSLAIDVLTRQQWMGFDGAPRTYYANAHSPINSTKASIGGYILSDKAGPVAYNSFSFTYSYLLRINRWAFLSMGINAGIDNYSISLNKLDIIEENDPHFAENIENKFKPVIGTGFVFFTPDVYIGISAPQIIPSKINYPQANNATLDLGYKLFFTAGVKKEFADGLALKLATLSRFSQYYINTYDFSAQFFFKDYVNIAASYRVKNCIAAIVGFQINNSIAISYSYDFPAFNNSINKLNNQELGISIDISKFYVKNKDREFLQKASKIADPGLRSIRHF